MWNEIDPKINDDFKLSTFDTKNIFTQKAYDGDVKEYKDLWNQFEKSLTNHKYFNNSNVYLHNIDSIFMKYLSFIPSTTIEYNIPNVPLYDHLKSSAIFASSLYSYHEDDLDIEKIKDLETKKFLIIAGDFFGIQKFIFDDVPAKKASKTLRGKSAFIQILTKLISFYIVEKLNLSYLNIVSTAAGKFEIVGCIKDVEKLKQIQKELDEFFLEFSFGEYGVGISYIEASGEDFQSKNYAKLREQLSLKVEEKKYKKFDLQNINAVFDVEIKDNLCGYCNKRFSESEDKPCKFCDIFIKIGEKLAKSDFLRVSKTKQKDDDLKIFNYFIGFDDRVTEQTLAIFDISKDEEFKNFAKWELKSYVALNEDEEIATFKELAKKSFGEFENGKRVSGIEAMMTLKADVDGMGDLLKKEKSGVPLFSSYAKFNFFSRLIDYFFSVNVPKMMREKYPNSYTIFAGGDDLYLVGAWHEILDLSRDIRVEFGKFSKECLTISMGLILTKPNKPIKFISDIAEESLEKSKHFERKNKKSKDAITVFEESIGFEEFLDSENLVYLIGELERVDKDIFKLNTSFIYTMIDFCNMSKNIDEKIENTMWKSKFRYFTYRNVFEKIKDNQTDEIESFLNLLQMMIDKHPKATKIALFEFVYKRRESS
ncbi:MAG: type III-A CRISPR-associated protein Cas10/Csm1 [Campylobacterales bacterium]|nr:type III-A CRISPR-associated protein Cas10/Csm1 [Campylobacterales bacterium]